MVTSVLIALNTALTIYLSRTNYMSELSIFATQAVLSVLYEDEFD